MPERTALEQSYDALARESWIFYERAHVERALEHVKLGVEMSLERVPYADEHPSRRAYILARKVR